MIQFLKRWLRPLRHKIRRLLGSITFWFLKYSCIVLKPKVIFTYLNTGKADGIGAQIQRILAIRTLSASLRLGYLHTEIKSLAIHPLDPYQTADEMNAFLHDLNREFWMHNSYDHQVENFREIQTKTLSFSLLFLAILKSNFSKKTTLLSLVEPYPVSEFDPDLYGNILRFLPNFTPAPKLGVVIAVHYRRGVGGLAIQRGEKISREIAGDYFAALVKEIIDAHEGSEIKLLVFTDSPAEDVIFVPPSDQSGLWATSKRFSEGKMHVLGLDVGQVFKDLTVDVEVVYGGDPLEIIRILASVDHLILSRSSFGYVGAILNHKGAVYFPSQFWHVPMKGWRVINESNYSTNE